jgi:hypothetical protein
MHYGPHDVKNQRRKKPLIFLIMFTTGDLTEFFNEGDRDHCAVIPHLRQQA